MVTFGQIFKIRIHRNFFIRQQQSKQLVKVTMIGRDVYDRSFVFVFVFVFCHFYNCDTVASIISDPPDTPKRIRPPHDAQPLEQRVRDALVHVRGTYGIAVVDTSRPDRIVIARKGSPVIIGIGDREMFVASDIAALVRHTRQVVHLDDGEVAVIDARGFQTMTMDARPISKSPATVEWEDDAYERDGHAHYMYKEILDQPEAIGRTLGGRLDRQFHTSHLGGGSTSRRANCST